MGATRIMENTQVYRLWQAPFAHKKFVPILAHNDLSRVQRVLDVGCGPGTNAQHFSHAQYLGVDHNLRYLQDARRRHGKDFLAADATRLPLAPQARFDFILVNSFLHHVDTADVRNLLAQLAAPLTEDGHVHILDLVLPVRPSVARFLARHDRGEFPRPLEQWEDIFSQSYVSETFEPYPVTGLGTTLWQMVYFKGRRKR